MIINKNHFQTYATVNDTFGFKCLLCGNVDDDINNSSFSKQDLVDVYNNGVDDDMCIVGGCRYCGNWSEFLVEIIDV